MRRTETPASARGWRGWATTRPDSPSSTPHTPLSLDGIPAGRAPYAPGLRGKGFAGTTFDLLRGPHWTLLVFSDNDTDLTPFDGLPGDVHLHRIGAGAILDARNRASERFRAGPGSVVLVRPDGYLAAHLRITESQRILEYLDSVAAGSQVPR